MSGWRAGFTLPALIAHYHKQQNTFSLLIVKLRISLCARARAKQSTIDSFCVFFLGPFSVFGVVVVVFSNSVINIHTYATAGCKERKNRLQFSFSGETSESTGSNCDVYNFIFCFRCQANKVTGHFFYALESMKSL
jgi:hypothetical protein